MYFSCVLVGLQDKTALNKYVVDFGLLCVIMDYGLYVFELKTS